MASLSSFPVSKGSPSFVLGGGSSGLGDLKTTREMDPEVKELVQALENAGPDFEFDLQEPPVHVDP